MVKKISHVESNTSVSDGRKLSAELMENLKKHAWERNFYSGHDDWLNDSNFVEV